MTEPEVIVVGAGPAGLSAAVELAAAGLGVLVVDQAAAPGGAIHRQPLPGAPSIASRSEARRWAALMEAVTAQGAGLAIRCATRFGGVDSDGTVLLTGALNALRRPRALVLATGARERVQPRKGWTLPGVMTAGAMQMQMKLTGQPPQGRLLLAGSGPLLLAVAAQLARLGNPPLAVVEAARPFAAPLRALGLPPAYLAEAARHLLALRRAGVPLLTGARLIGIAEGDHGLIAEIRGPSGSRSLKVDSIGLHDGIAPNDTGLTAPAGLRVLRLGDCAEALGGRAALAGGRAGGRALAAELAGRPAPPDDALARERAAQARLARIYRHDGLSELAGLPADTVLCRCENRTLADLRALGPAPTDRQLRLDGRFAMGGCQGRFCAEWVRRLTGPDPVPPFGIGAARWPARPIAVADLLAAGRDDEGDDR